MSSSEDGCHIGIYSFRLVRMAAGQCPAHGAAGVPYICASWSNTVQSTNIDYLARYVYIYKVHIDRNQLLAIGLGNEAF